MTLNCDKRTAHFFWESIKLLLLKSGSFYAGVAITKLRDRQRRQINERQHRIFREGPEVFKGASGSMPVCAESLNSKAASVAFSTANPESMPSRRLR
jgi:hypothetical protein